MLTRRLPLDRLGYALLGVLYLADALACRSLGDACRDNLTRSRRAFIAAME